MSGTRGGIGRIIAMGVALAVALLLLLAGEARAGKYTVAQCGWYVGADADWADTTGGAKFRPDSWCVPAPDADPFDGAHVKSFTRDGQATVSGTRFARWRWLAPAGTGITQVRGSWWHALHDGIEQRLGVDNPGGGFDVFAAAATTDTTPRDFTAGFATPMPAFEDRLLCARAEAKWCSLEAGSWSALRALTITLEDGAAPSAASSGELLAGGWRRGSQGFVVSGADTGSGLRFAESTLDGSRVALTELSCAKAMIGGEWRATAMRPCPLSAAVGQALSTTAFSDGPHSFSACVADFSGSSSCLPPRTVLIDNNPPAHPMQAALAGGDGWRRSDGFDLAWTDPDQGVASPIAAASWRLTGPGGYDSGVRSVAGVGIAKLADLTVPAPGAYLLRVWLRDEAGNEAPANAVEVPLRFDDVPPQVAFAAGGPESAVVPAEMQVEATVSDPLSGPGSGQILYRRADSDVWVELPTKLRAGEGSGPARLTAPVPELSPGTYLFRADASDAAGNAASSTLRADGTRMEIHVAAPPPAAKTRLFAGLFRAAGEAASSDGAVDSGGQTVTVAFGDGALLSGRLTAAGGDGLAGRELRIVARPSRGAPGGPEVSPVRTDRRGGFELHLPPGASRRLTVSFPGGDGLAAASRGGLVLRVRSGVSLQAAPDHLQTGEVLRLRGRVASGGAPFPRRGKLVAIQYREEATGRWRPVLVTRSGHDGAFHAHYRFRYVSGRTEIKLRATVLSEERWPFAPGSSRPLTVVVNGDR
ncbi:MAG TPA: hypothetical protein VMT37_06105 [Solirubrobacterales bacterium]|nr:hypothetical protein [Solirubrobacterales bacterium]